MNPSKEYSSKFEKDNKYASYLKRVLSSIVDVVSIYSFYLLLNLFLIMPYKQLGLQKYLGIFTFLYGLFFTYWCYRNLGRTVGDKLNKIKPIFENQVTNESKLLFKRSFIQSLVFVPYASPACLILASLILFFSVISLLIDKGMRLKRVFLWDALSKMVVIND